MENTNKLESGFKINNLILVESCFNRINNVVFEGFKKDLNIRTDVSVNGNVITVAEEATITQTYNEVEQVKIKVKMVGIFECIGEPSIRDFGEFGKINGAAIIYPYIREHVTNLSLKGGVGAIIIPPVNFTKNE